MHDRPRRSNLSDLIILYHARPWPCRPTTTSSVRVTSSSMHKVYLHVRGGHPFKDHHTLYVPSLSSPTTGKSVHCEGSPLLGFVHVVERGYDPKSGRSSGTFLLGDVDDSHIVDVADHATEEGDLVKPIDAFERTAFSVPAPGKSLRSATVPGGDKVRPSVPVEAER